MSAIVVSLTKDQVFVATDTLVTDGDTLAPSCFVSKIYALPHLYGVMCVTGLTSFAADWFRSIYGFLVRDLDDLNDLVPTALLQLAQQYSFNFEGGRKTTIYHFGYSAQQDRCFGFRYRSDNEFQSESLVYGLGAAPGVNGAENTTYPAGFIELMERQRAADSQQPPAARLFIGGEIQGVCFSRHGTIIKTIHRFNDYEELYGQMLDERMRNIQAWRSASAE